MLNKFIFTVTAASAITAFAASNTYKVDILDNTTIEGKQLKAGSYKVEVENNTAVLKSGKNAIEVPAHTEQAASKYSGTQIQYVDNAVHEIHIGGTNTKIVFATAENGSPAGGSN